MGNDIKIISGIFVLILSFYTLVQEVDWALFVGLVGLGIGLYLILSSLK